MKKLIILILMLITLSSYSQSNEYVQEKLIASFATYYDNGQMQQTGFVSVLNMYDSINCTSRLISVVDSTWLLYANNGKLIQKCYYNEGLKTGTWEWFLEDSTVQVVYVEGVKVRYLEVSLLGKLLFLKDF